MFVNRSPRGYFADELARALHVEVQDALRQLTQQRRVTREIVSGLYLAAPFVCGLESLKLGRGGDRQLADFLDLDPHTVARGRQQLLAQDVEVDRARRTGGGRKPVEKKRPK